jgi:HAD superfamily hydrolase (TIGR01549 family)
MGRAVAILGVRFGSNLPVLRRELEGPQSARKGHPRYPSWLENWLVGWTSDISRCYFDARLVASGDQLCARQGSVKQIDRMQRIKAISFDGDMTLWDFEAVMRHSLRHALAELHKRLPASQLVDLTIDRMIEIRNAVATELRGQSLNLEEIRLEAFVRTLRTIGLDDHDLAAHLNAVYLKHRFEDIQLYSDVLPVLEVLHKHYVLGLLSNGNSYPERRGLQGHFAFFVFARDVGVEKPHPGMFRAACREAGCSPDELMHVGDSLQSDVQGANEVGALSVWLNRRRLPRPSNVNPDFEVGTLTELCRLIELR